MRFATNVLSCGSLHYFYHLLYYKYMTNLAFDTLKLSELFQVGGFSKQQSETLLRAVREIDTSRLVTEPELDRRLELFDQRLEARLSRQTLHIITWIIGALVAQGTLVIAILQLLRS